MVVAAIKNSCTAPEQLKIEFPSDHAEQLRLAKGFQQLSTAKFDCCVGAIDGILIWTERPTKAECDQAQWGPLKYMCGRKKKFGMNMMGTVDYRGRFLDVEIRHPGSTSDYLAFATSDLKADLETPGFLYPGLVLFGDNAYSNSSYMVTPFKAGKEGELGDDFNYYQSQHYKYLFESHVEEALQNSYIMQHQQLRFAPEICRNEPVSSMFFCIHHI